MIRPAVQHADIPPPQSATRGLHHIACKLLFISLLVRVGGWVDLSTEYVRNSLNVACKWPAVRFEPQPESYESDTLPLDHLQLHSGLPQQVFKWGMPHDDDDDDDDNATTTTTTTTTIIVTLKIKMTNIFVTNRKNEIAEKATCRNWTFVVVRLIKEQRMCHWRHDGTSRRLHEWTDRWTTKTMNKTTKFMGFPRIQTLWHITAASFAPPALSVW